MKLNSFKSVNALFFSHKQSNMSYANKRPTHMHCKVCESAKKPLSVISSHNPRNRDGFTVCPTLLAQQCRGCGKKGHTVGYCPKEQREQREKEKEREKHQQQQKKEKTEKKKQEEVVFNVLYESSDDEKQEQVQVQEKVKKVKKVKDPNAKFCWATAESDSDGSDSD